MSDYKEQANSLREHADLIETSGIELYGPSATRLLVYDLRNAAAAIEALQAEVKRLEPKRGEWIEGDGRRVTARCSVCGHLRLGNGAEYANKHVHFCENCGSKIGGQNDEP